MKNILKKLLVIISFVCIAEKSLAWGRTGHQIVAQVAFHYLDNKTKEAVKHYLGKTSIEDAATWMDDVRSNDFYNYMRTWHYVDVDKGEKFANNPADRNAVIVLNSAIRILEKRDNLKDSKIKEYIQIVFHLVGDLHQPLHTGYSVDKGGNTINIESPIYGGNLHSFWDTQILESKGITMEDCVKMYNGLTKEEIADIQKVNIIKWMNQSRGLLDEVYNFKDNKITQAYIDKNAEVTKKQLLLGGLRLAAVLREIFGSDNSTVTTTNNTTDNIPVLEMPVADSSAKTIVSIKAEEAAKYEGKMVKVCTKIYGGKYNEASKTAPTLLNAGGDYPGNPLTLVIWNDKRANFKNAPEVFYKGKDVCVTGVVKIYKGKPEIIVMNEEQIQLNTAGAVNNK